MNITAKYLSIILASSIISGCGIGQKKVLFTTRSNVGLDVDAKQFTAQINIDRQEAVIGPTFEGGQHVPIVAAFRNNNRLLGGFGVSSLFAGGDAALALTTPSESNRVEGESLISLSKPPQYIKGFFGKFFDHFKDEERIQQDKYLPGPGQVTPFIFDTDTSLGIKLAWTGAAAEFPDKVKIGFNREEFALAPVVATYPGTNEEVAQKQKILADVGAKIIKESEVKVLSINNNIQSIKNKTNNLDEIKKLETERRDNEENTAKLLNQLEYTKNKSYQVGVPSFFAALDTNSGFNSIANTEIGFRQIFAAGKSATNLANNSDIKILINERFQLSNATLCLSKWLKADNKSIDTRDNKARADELQKWLDDKNHSAKTIDELVSTPLEWQAFASLNISPGVCQNGQ
jgi:hypothetical protein